MILSENDWHLKQHLHHVSVKPLIDAWRQRRFRNETHPVYDFMFTYYSFKPSYLKKWHPGYGVSLSGASADKFLFDPHYEKNNGIVQLKSSIPQKVLSRIEELLQLQRAIADRPPAFGCKGLHEWAMVYRLDALRHTTCPLRLTPSEINSFVETQHIVCSHYDAFRFFSSDARPLNHLQPIASSKITFEQSGCLHANMDLYRSCYKLSPWIGSDLLRQAFELAVTAREIDMRASPYDLRHFGFDPVCIETESGAKEYDSLQRRVHQLALPIRRDFIAQCSNLLYNQNVSD